MRPYKSMVKPILKMLKSRSITILLPEETKKVEVVHKFVKLVGGFFFHIKSSSCPISRLRILMIFCLVLSSSNSAVTRSETAITRLDVSVFGVCSSYSLVLFLGL